MLVGGIGQKEGPCNGGSGWFSEPIETLPEERDLLCSSYYGVMTMRGGGGGGVEGNISTVGSGRESR